jgi:hypothetical protein
MSVAGARKRIESEVLEHHILPKSGWVSFYLRKPEAIAEAIALLRLSYEIAVKQKGLESNAHPSSANP